MRKKRYTGELDQPMQEIYFPPSREGVKKALRDASQEEAHKLHLLFQYYGIEENDENAGLKLALSLARVHVPGFKRHKKPGAKVKWNILDCNDLKKEVDEIIEENKKKGITGHQNSKMNAFKKLANNDRWKKLTGNKIKTQEIKKMYYQANPDWLKLSDSQLKELHRECEARGILIPRLLKKNP